jgi:hypothetical protein
MLRREKQSLQLWLCSFNFFVVFACPDLKIIQAGEKPDCRQAGFVFPLRLFFTAKHVKYYAKERKAGQKEYI